MNELQAKLSELGEGLKAEYKASRKAAMWNAVNAAKPEIEGERYDKMFFTYKPYFMHPYADVLKKAFVPSKKKEAEETGKGYYSGSLHDPLTYYGDEKVEAIIEKEAEYDTRMMFEAFVNKNLKKLAGVVKEEAKLSKVNGRVDSGLTGWMDFEMVDGRMFEMTFNVVTKVSSKGKWFQQFPTRFHNVVLADGSKMKNASEAKMKKEF